LGNFGETRDGVGKNGVLEHKSDNISETRTDRGNVTMDGLYKNSPTLFRTVLSSSPYGLLFAKIGGSQPPPKTPVAIKSLLSQEATDFKFWRKGIVGAFIACISRKKCPIKNSGK